MTIDTNQLRKIVQTQLIDGGKVSDQMHAVIDILEKNDPHADWEKFRKIPYDRLAPMRNWLNHRFESEPPYTPVAGLWFGICHTRNGSKTADLYLSASTRFSRDDLTFRWTVDPEYRPDYGFARSNALWKIYRGAHAKKGGLKQTAERPLCLAYSAFVLPKLLSDVDPQLFLNGNASAGVAVGFEVADAILLGELNQDGFQLAALETKRRSSRQRQEKLKDRSSFWNLIAELIAATGGDLNAFEKLLDAELSRRSATEIRSFCNQFCELLDEACTWDLYCAATIIGCGSENSFLDFRRWLVFQGPRNFARILNDIDSLGSYDPASNPVEQWYSEYHPHHVYAKVAKRNLRSWKVQPFPDTSDGLPSEEHLASHYPKLCKRMRRKLNECLLTSKNMRNANTG